MQCNTPVYYIDSCTVINNNKVCEEGCLIRHCVSLEPPLLNTAFAPEFIACIAMQQGTCDANAL